MTIGLPVTTMHSAERYREIDVRGTPHEIGRQLGEAAREEIRGFCDAALDRIHGQEPISIDDALRLASDSIPFVQRYAPHSLHEIRGIAEGAGVSVEQVMLLQVRNQLDPDADAGCTSVALPMDESTGRGPIVAQNWDNDADLDQYVVVLTRRPTTGPALMTVGPAGLIAYIGFNEHEVAACLNMLPAPRRRLGVPHFFTLREILGSRSLDGAVSAVRRAERAIPANIMLSTPQGPADLEVTIDEVHVLHDDGLAGSVTHTNHCLHPSLQAIAARFGDLGQSRARKARIDALLRTKETDLDRLRTALGDHAAYPRSICRHANDDTGIGYWQTVMSVIIEPQQQRMQVSRGNPCEHPYESYLLN